MQKVKSAQGTAVSYESRGSGPPLVLVHGGFSDHRTNWEFVLPMLEKQFTLYAVARRGRGGTEATAGHTLEDESRDAAAVIQAAGEPVFLLGHSYGAHVALAAAVMMPDRVRKLVLYEAPWPHILSRDVLQRLTMLADSAAWESLSRSFFNEVLLVPMKDLDELRGTEHWAPIVEDAKASLGDLRALSNYDFRPERFRGLQMPVLLQIGSQSPRHLFVTDALAQVLRNVRIEVLEGQAHEGMTTAPGLYAESVAGFLLETAQPLLEARASGR